MTSPDTVPHRRETLLNAAALLFSTIVVITCSATSPSPPSPPSLPLPSPPPSIAASAAPPTTTSSAQPLLSAALPALPSPAPLSRFYAALAALSTQTRTSHVRILWLGDSHTAADLWTGEVRRILQKQYGDGGPGFVHAGWDKFNHEQVRTKVGGRWRTQPGDYARIKRYDDGILGLGGVRFVPREPGSTSTLDLRTPEKNAPYTWEIAYRLPQGAGLQLQIGKHEARQLQGSMGLEILHEQVQSTGEESIELRATQGEPQLFGVVVEAKKPGLVLDTVGLNGARVRTFLAWEPSAWVPEVARRKPDLVVLAFGTNESSDTAPEAQRYEDATRQLLERVRQAAPEADCLIITPMDRAGSIYPPRLDVISEGMAAAAKQKGCGVWSAMSAMGGPGSMKRWAAETPARGGADGVHLTARGYQTLGKLLAQNLIEGASSQAGLPLEKKAP